MRKAKLDLSKWSAWDVNNLPDMQVDGKVWLPYLYDNQEIKRIPIIGLKVGGDLHLEGCESLTSLPEGLEVGGDLSLNRCGSLTFLPKGLSVEGGLNLNRCGSLTSLPQDLQVKGTIYYNSKTGFTQIEGWEDDPTIIPTHLRGKLRKL